MKDKGKNKRGLEAKTKAGPSAALRDDKKRKGRSRFFACAQDDSM
jgi:hypothetical protein